MALFFFCIIVSAFAQRPPTPQGPLTPQRALAAFQVDPGLEVDLVASEPTVGDPVALAFDDATGLRKFVSDRLFKAREKKFRA